jgi:hypothetical protein
MADYLYQSDIDNYGPELIDVTQRAALQAVGPHLENLAQQNAALRQRLAIESRRRLDQQIAAAVPNYQEIDRDPRWHRWLLGIDTLSGRVRQHLLNDAIASGDANRVYSFFKGFEREAGGALSAGPGPALSTHASGNRQTLPAAPTRRLYRGRVGAAGGRFLRGPARGPRAGRDRLAGQVGEFGSWR